MLNFPEVLCIGPKIVAIDAPVREPKRPVMRVIVLFARRIFHRPIAGHWEIVRTEDRIAIWPGNVLEKVFREQFAVDLDAQSVVQLRDLDAFTRAGPEGKKEA